MKILMINKFLYPKGGAETYVFRLGESLQALGHEVQYFGMEHPDNIVGNAVNACTKNLDFHNSSRWTQLTYPFRIIYSAEARKQIRRVLEDLQPDVCHLNNFNYQLTPSVILEIRKWEKETGRRCRIVYTAHDPQLVCPNHMCMNPNTHRLCKKCLHGSFWNCTEGRCIHGSFVRSVIGSLEAIAWKWAEVYRQIDTIICCSHFMKGILDTNPLLASKTVVLHNFIEIPKNQLAEKKEYVLYFGRYSQEKGIATLVQAAKQLPHIPFVFAGSGPLEHLVEDVPNIRNVGFLQGEALETLIREARFSVISSECYENCPFSVLESIASGTPVLGADIGGIPELIRGAGELFESGNVVQLVKKLEELWGNPEKLAGYANNCKNCRFDTAHTYTEKVLSYYEDAGVVIREWRKL